MLQHTADGACAMSCLQVVFDLQTLVHLSGVVTQARIRHSWVLTLPPRGYSEPVGYSQYPRSSTCRAWLRRHGSHSHGGEHTPRTHALSKLGYRSRTTERVTRPGLRRTQPPALPPRPRARTHAPPRSACSAGRRYFGQVDRELCDPMRCACVRVCLCRLVARVCWPGACAPSPRRYSAAVLRGCGCVARRPTCGPW